MLGARPLVRIFAGRPDGIGNRVEELIRLGAVAAREGERVVYLWNNTNPDPARRYAVWLRAGGLHIIAAPTFGRDRVRRLFARALERLRRRSQTLQVLSGDVTRAEALASAARIRPTFEVSFPAPALGVHIRGSDRVDPTTAYPDHFMAHEDELLAFVDRALAHALAHPLRDVFVCSDDHAAYERVARALAASGKRLVRPRAPQGVPQEYVDFFALSRCAEVALAAKYSSFSLTAALIGRVPVKTFGTPQHLLDRHFATPATSRG